VTERLSELVVS